jgi:lysophospholipase L1-like esterase
MHLFQCVKTFWPYNQVLSIVFLACAYPDTLSASQFYQDPGDAGLVAIEAENYTNSSAGSSHSWVVPPLLPNGYSGTGVMEAAPNDGTLIKSDDVSTSPRLGYEVNFAKTGIHFVWVRGQGATLSDDSLHVGLNNSPSPTATRISNFSTVLGWSNTQMGRDIAKINIPSTGLHTLDIWMREDGMSFDQVILTTDGNYVPPDPPGAILFEDNFDSNDLGQWTLIDNCPISSPQWSVEADGVAMQTNNCFGFNSDGIAEGTWLHSNTILPDSVEVRLKLRSEDPLEDPVDSNNSSNMGFGTIGILFGYQDSSNHYRFEMNARSGYRKLWLKDSDQFTELTTSPQSYHGGQWYELRLVHKDGVILVFLDGDLVLETEDATFSSGRVALFCAVNASCSFDDIEVSTALDTPMIGINLKDGINPAHSSSDYFVTAGNSLHVAGMTTEPFSVGGVEFVINEGNQGEVIQVDISPPYEAHFQDLPSNSHTINAYLLDSNSSRLSSSGTGTTLGNIGTGGIHIHTLGDSITWGLLDDIMLDNISTDGRNTGTGYAIGLNDYLSAGNPGKPVSVINDGISGEKTAEGVARLASVLARTPSAQAYLVGFGTNDSGGSLPLLSGFGKNPGNSGYDGSYKDYMQQIIDAITLPPPEGAGKLVFFAKIPPYLSSSIRNNRIYEFNQVIDELVTQLKNQYPLRYKMFTSPDFHSYFTLNPDEMHADQIHPNGSGYQSMARLWCEALNGLEGWFCLDDDRDGLLNTTEAQIGTDPQLTDTDEDGLVDGKDGFVPLGAIPGGVDTNGDGFVDGEQVYSTDPMQADSDGDRLTDGLEAAYSSDPLDRYNWPVLADGDLAPLGTPDGQFNSGDLLVATRIVLGLVPATSLELAHGDVYPPGTPDGVISLQDLILLWQLL